MPASRAHRLSPKVDQQAQKQFSSVLSRAPARPHAGEVPSVSSSNANQQAADALSSAASDGNLTHGNCHGDIVAPTPCAASVQRRQLSTSARPFIPMQHFTPGACVEEYRCPIARREVAVRGPPSHPALGKGLQEESFFSRSTPCPSAQEALASCRQAEIGRRLQAPQSPSGQSGACGDEQSPVLPVPPGLQELAALRNRGAGEMWVPEKGRTFQAPESSFSLRWLAQQQLGFTHSSRPQSANLSELAESLDSEGFVAVDAHAHCVDAHAHGECRPCAYFWTKKDSCRHRDACEFCHLCPPGEIQRRRKEKRSKHKACKKKKHAELQCAGGEGLDVRYFLEA